MDTPTSDRNIVIEDRGPEGVRYRALDSGQRWLVRGTCNQCGLCVVGAFRAEHYEWHGDPGTPYAVTDLRVAEGRLDEPITPSFPAAMERMRQEMGVSNGCCLTIEVPN